MFGGNSLRLAEKDPPSVVGLWNRQNSSSGERAVNFCAVKFYLGDLADFWRSIPVFVLLEATR